MEGSGFGFVPDPDPGGPKISGSGSTTLISGGFTTGTGAVYNIEDSTGTV